MIPSKFWDNPARRPKFLAEMVKVPKLIATGRSCKAEGKAISFMREAYEIVTDLESQIRPARFVLKGFIWLAVTFITGIIAGLSASWFM